jgi:serine/threonine protein kinase
MIGTTVLHYKITEKLGEGGMGVVYKAHDTKLDRFVALKFLPSNASVNAETKARFTQEAKAAAALNHPNICTIHGVEEADGNLFIVMEYIDGGTLRDKVPYRTIDDAVTVAIQIGEALHEAHDKGIVHRDVKADNIMLTSKGQVKVMDFGLAKLKGTLKLTRTSSTVGTLAYMAPEQIQGGEVDQRSDIFSFGVLFFEMLTGKFPFRGEHEASLLYSIVNEEPESITKYLPDASSGLQQIFEKALEKDPSVRYHSVEDMVVDLRRTKKQTSKVSRIMPVSAPSTTSIPVHNTPPPKNNGMLVRAGLAIGLVVVITVGLLQFIGGSEEVPPFNDMKLTRLTADGKSTDVAVSPDGRYVAYVRFDKEKFNLWIRQVSTTNNIAITQPTEDLIGALTFSPNGDFLYYVTVKQGTSKSELHQISILGGNPKTILSRIKSRVSFSPDGKRFAYMTDSAEVVNYLAIADADGSNAKFLLSRHSPEHFDDLAWSPDGKHIGLIEGRSGSFMNHRLMIYSLEDEKEIVPEGQKWLTLRSINWMADSKGVIVSAADDQSSFDSPQLWYYPVKEGTAKRLTNNLNGYAFSSMDRNSTQLAALEPESFSNLHIVPANSAASAQQVTEGSKRRDGMKGVQWLNNERLIYSSQSGGYDNIWMIDGNGGAETQITSGAFVDQSAHPVPGQNTIIFSSNRSGSFNIWKSDINGSNLKQLTRGNYDIEPSVTSDGRWIYYGAYGDSGGTLWKMTIDGDSNQQVMSKHIFSYALSPDGRSIVYLFFDEKQEQRMEIMSLSTGAIELEKVSPNSIVQWTPDGKSFAFIRTQNGVSNIWTVPVAGGKEKQLTPFTTGVIFGFDWTPDGKKLAVARGESSSDIVLLTDTKKVQQ